MERERGGTVAAAVSASAASAGGASADDMITMLLPSAFCFEMGDFDKATRAKYCSMSFSRRNNILFGVGKKTTHHFVFLWLVVSFR